MSAVHIINLSPHFDYCCVCEIETDVGYGLAMFEDLVLPADWPGEWAGFTACARCYLTFTGIKEPIPWNIARATVAGQTYYGA